MAGTISGRVSAPDVDRASKNCARLTAHVAGLYCAGGSSSVSAYEMHELAMSIAFALGIADATPEEAAVALDVDDPIALWHEGVHALQRRTDADLALWRDVVATMPPIRNVALRDTLASLSELKRRYDVHFAAHEVPCDIDYQLSEPVDPGLLRIDYMEAYLAQLLAEARWIARFDVESCVAVLEGACPDYRGLHVNLCDLLLPHTHELVTSSVRHGR